MIVLLVVGVAALVAIVLVVVRHVTSSGTPLDVEGEEQWLVAHAPIWLARPIRSLDRRVVGGAAVGVTFLAVFVTAAVIGWIFSGLDDQRGIARWDQSAAEYGRDHATATSTDVLRAITNFGGTVYVIVAMVVLGVYHAVRRSDRGPLIYLLVVGVGVTALNNLLKVIVDRDRPDIAQLAGHAGASFPSGHSAAAAACWAAMALVIARRRHRAIRVAAASIAVFIAVAVATSRVLLGVHWLSDVVAGVVVGWAWCFVITVVFGGRFLRLGEPAERLTDPSSVPSMPSRPSAPSRTEEITAP